MKDDTFLPDNAVTKQTAATYGEEQLRAYASQPEVFRQEAVTTAKNTETREILLARIRLLEQALDRFEEREQRYAYVLRTFYFSTLSLAALQPLTALAVELNPEIVEQRR